METRDRLLAEAEKLFARRGVDRVTSREIVEAADQRNVSAVTYYFGSREGLLQEILSRRGGPVDIQRMRYRDLLGDEPTVDDLLRCLIKPYIGLLTESEGRCYVRIVAQLRGKFAAWRVASDAATTKQLAKILDEIEQQMPVHGALRRERTVAMIMLLTGMVAERAARQEVGERIETTDKEFANDLVSMCSALVVA